jgi:hypothetical protein
MPRDAPGGLSPLRTGRPFMSDGRHAALFDAVAQR